MKRMFLALLLSQILSGVAASASNIKGETAHPTKTFKVTFE